MEKATLEARATSSDVVPSEPPEKEACARGHQSIRGREAQWLESARARRARRRERYHRDAEDRREE